MIQASFGLLCNATSSLVKDLPLISYGMSRNNKGLRGARSSQHWFGNLTINFTTSNSLQKINIIYFLISFPAIELQFGQSMSLNPTVHSTTKPHLLQANTSIIRAKL